MSSSEPACHLLKICQSYTASLMHQPSEIRGGAVITSVSDLCQILKCPSLQNFGERLE